MPVKGIPRRRDEAGVKLNASAGRGFSLQTRDGTAFRLRSNVRDTRTSPNWSQ